MTTVSNADDIIDSRDILARIQELHDARAAHPCFCGEEDCQCAENAKAEHWREENPDDAAELAALEALASEAEGCADWKYGETLIRDSYFQDYAQQLAEDCGYVNPTASWPHSCIDWEYAARELKYDYTGVDFDGVTYWVHS